MKQAFTSPVLQNQSVEISSTRLTPSILLDITRGIFEIKGSSAPESAIEFYTPLYTALDALVTRPRLQITANFRLEYFNTSSSKCIYMLLKRLSDLASAGHGVRLNWYYDSDDEDMFEIGQDYRDLLNLEINLIEF